MEIGFGNSIASTPVNNGLGHHVAATLDSLPAPYVTNVKFYVDGQLDSISGGANAAINTTALDDVLIGTDIQNRLFTGIIDEVRIYNRALSAAEIAALYNEGRQSAAAWHRRYFGDAAINWATDDDGDGVTRLGEYAFGGQPHISDSQVMRVIPELVGGHLRIRFNRRQAGTHELVYQIQQSTTLNNWTALSGSEVSVTSSVLPGFEDVTFQASASVSGTSPLFVRLTASLP
jgi:hypothetical protein